MKDIHWGTLIVGILIGAIVLPSAVSMVRGMGGQKAQATQ